MWDEGNAAEAWAGPSRKAPSGSVITQFLSLFGQSANKEGRIMRRYLALGAILILALIAFELFNFDTTQYALDSLLGGIDFMGVGWATILAIAFCGIDFAGLARLFMPGRDEGGSEPKEAWYLMGAWFLAAAMNAVMTWWAVSLAVLQHPLGNEIVGREELIRIVPVFVAVLVWLTRVLIIAALTMAGDRLLRPAATARVASGNGRAASRPAQGAHVIGGEREPAYAMSRGMSSGPRPAPKPSAAAAQSARSTMMASAVYEGGQSFD